jgi:hypothetical protein
VTYGIQLVTSPTSEPVSLAEAKLHLHVDFDDEDSLIQGLIYAAREVVEGKLRRSVFMQTWQLTLDQFPYPTEVLTKSPSQRDNYLFPSLYYSYYAIELPRTKVVSITSIAFQTIDGETVTLDPSLYAVDTNSEPARIVPKNGATWPYVDNFLPGSIVVTFVAGQWDANSVPASIKQAMLLLIGNWYANREAASELNLKIVPMAVDALLERWTYYGP